MSIKKQHFKKKGICKVTFAIPESRDNGVEKIQVVGEFNNWSQSATPMKRSRNGFYTASVDLEQGREYQFRYLIDGQRWENDPEADHWLDSPYGDARNSVVVT
jgi:1,4-alpha-glucan branching enzyme